MPQVRLIKQIDENECARRNALLNKPVGLRLTIGEVGTVVDIFGGGTEFLVEFGVRGPDQCDWLGVLYASELQKVSEIAQAA